MPLKKSDGNMYPWVTHTHSHLGGVCPHECVYCYVQWTAQTAPWPNTRKRYSGPVRTIPKELEVRYGSGKTIFIEHMNDLFAEGVDPVDVAAIRMHLEKWPDNTYVFQSKNPPHPMLNGSWIRDRDMLGTTIESNRHHPDDMGKAPLPLDRKEAMMDWLRDRPLVTRFITVEPIMEFDLAELVTLIRDVQPAFVNIGADSKGYHLPEPPWGKVENLIGALEMAGVEIRRKTNLERLKRA